MAYRTALEYLDKRQPSLTGLAVRALTVETADSVDARGTVETGSSGAIVDVHRTVLSRPSIDTNAVVRTERIGTGRPVMADARPHRALVDVHLA